MPGKSSYTYFCTCLVVNDEKTEMRVNFIKPVKDMSRSFFTNHDGTWYISFMLILILKE